MPVITGSTNNQRPLPVTSGEYATYDIDQNQDVRETIQMLTLNLSMKRRYLIEADQAYHGNTSHRMIGTEQFRRTFHHLRHFTDNWLKMIVDAYVARLVIQGFNLGGKDANDQAWGLWRANGLDKYANLAHREAMKMGECYLMVDPTMTVKGYPRITVETPFQMIGWQDPTDRSKNVCALKYFQAADGYMYALLYDVDRVRKFRSPQSYYRWSEAGMLEHLPVPQSIPWAQYDEVEHDLGVCPVFTIENQPTLTRGGVSDLEELIPLQRSIDVLLKNMMLASEYAAFPQKYAINVAIERDENGNPRIDQGLESAMSRFWAFPPPERENAPPVEVGAFPAVQVQNYVAAMEEVIHNMAMISSVPAYRLIGKLANMPLALDTVIPTPWGRTTMGEVEVGDTIYAPDGSEQQVVEVLPIKRSQPCYRLTFDDGTTIVADADHRWETTHFTDPDRPYSKPQGHSRADRETSVLTTAQIAGSLRTAMGTYNHFIPVAAPAAKPERHFAIDPYALGVYLGDGSRHTGWITAHVRDAHGMAERLRAAGETVQVVSYPEHDTAHKDTRTIRLTRDHDRCHYGHERPRSTHDNATSCPRCAAMYKRHEEKGEPYPPKVNEAFRTRLRHLGVLYDKHIPEEYFHGSVEQRLALLQGVMDTDGTVNRSRGSVALTLANKRLMDDVRRLAQSLGHKLAVRGSIQSPRAKGAGNHIWHATWKPPHIVFRMERKARLQTPPHEEGDGRAASPFRRYIVACEKVASVPVRCINVSHPSHLFCVTDAFVATRNSASAIIAAEAGFTDCCRVKSTDYSTGWEHAIGTGLQVMGVEYEWMETLWKDPSAVNGPNVAASLVLLKEIGVPQRELFKMLGIGPQETEAWLDEADEEAKQAAEAEKKAEPKISPDILNAALTQLASNNSPNGNSSGDTDNNVSGNSLSGSEPEN